MKRIEEELIKGIWALPSFPVVLVTVGHNIMTAAAFHFYSFKPPCVMVGIIHYKFTNLLINEYNEFGINIPASDQIEIVHKVRVELCWQHLLLNLRIMIFFLLFRM